MQRLQLKEQRRVLCLHRLTIHLSAATSKARGMKLVIKAAAMVWWRMIRIFPCVLNAAVVAALDQWVLVLKKRDKFEQQPITHLYPHTYTSCLHPLSSLPTRGRPDVAVTRVVRRRCSVELPEVMTINTSAITWASTFAYSPALIWGGSMQMYAKWNPSPNDMRRLNNFYA